MYISLTQIHNILTIDLHLPLLHSPLIKIICCNHWSTRKKALFGLTTNCCICSICFLGVFFNKNIILYIIKYIDAFSEASHFEKAGECPVASPYTAGVCSYDCSYDAECEDDKKCCREREREMRSLGC